jgi:hypothetical protein
MKLLVIWTAFLLSWSTNAYPQQGTSPTKAADAARVPDAVRERLVQIMPKPLPAQATAQEAPAFYTSANLYQYMDGAADVVLLYDFQTLFHQEFQAGKVDLTVDVFDMGSPQDAFGIYASERSPKYDFVAIGAEGYRNEGIVNFLQDRYYVKLAAFGDGADGVLDQFAKGLSARIGGSRTFPALIGQLPSANRKAHTEQYMRKDPLGHAFLSPAYQADYAWGKGESKLMVSVGRDAADAQERLKLLAEHFRQSGQCKAAPEFGEGAIRATNTYEGTLVARAKGRYLILLLNPAAGAENFFRDAAERLQ